MYALVHSQRINSKTIIEFAERDKMIGLDFTYNNDFILYFSFYYHTSSTINNLDFLIPVLSFNLFLCEVLVQHEYLLTR